ncbi:MAG: sialate O-acetylesterase [Tannerellaceae bacterium]
MKLKHIAGIALLQSFATFSFAQINLPSVFTDHMVLQQNSEAAIWGWGNASETVRIVGSWNTADTIAVKVDNAGKWSGKLKTANAGGPYTIEVMGSSRVKLNDVMLGEVWLCSGQSNMEWSHNHDVFNKEEEIAAANHPNLRIFHIPKRGDAYPQNDCTAQWEVSSPESMRRTSAVGYFFARELMEQLDVPVGIIVSAWGGTPAEVWTPAPLIEANKTLREAKITPTPWWPEQPGALYNQMINPVVPYKLAGSIWYQGESNRVNPSSYGLLMKTMIEGWRSAFDNNFPFYFVQIAPHTYNSDTNGPALLREQQELVAKEVPNTGMVVVSDLVDDIKNIHPKNKLDVGKRLANMAMAKTYGKPVVAIESPLFESVSFKGNKAYVSFANLKDGLVMNGKKAEALSIAGEDMKFYPANAKIENGTLVVWAKEVKKPVAVHYMFDDSSIGNLFSKEGLPIAPFRTEVVLTPTSAGW